MFSFFKRKEKIHLNGWENELFQNVFKILGKEFSTYQEQISEGIIESVRFDKEIPNYINFRLNIPLLNKFEKKNEEILTLSGIKVYDKTIQDYKILNIQLGFGLVLGYSIIDIFNFNPDTNKIRIDTIKKIYNTNEDFEKIKFLFSNEDINLLNPSDIYKIELDGKTYYHLKDLEDGDFLGIDTNKNIYIISHDPFQINLQKERLNSFLNQL